MEYKEDVEDNITTPGVLDKYQTSGTVANLVLKEVLEKIVEGADIFEICRFGDSRIFEETSKYYSKKKGIEKGVAFPTCISVNDIVGHFSPLKEDSLLLKKGDVVKVDLGVHFDGFISVAAHTKVIGDCKENSDLVMAAWNTLQAVVRKILSLIHI